MKKTRPGDSQKSLALATLQQSDELFRIMVASVTDYAIFMMDREGHVTTWNAGAERIKGYSAEEIIGRHFSIFYPAEAIARGWPQRELEMARALGRFEDEGPRIRKDGTNFWANVIITAVYGPEGALRGFSKVTRDLTERRRAEENLRAAYAELEGRVAQRTLELADANASLKAEVAERVRLENELRALVEQLRTLDRQKNEFLATLAHELRNPLAPLRTGIELLKLGQGVATPFSGTLDMLERQLFHLTRLVDDLIDVSRITRNVLELRLHRVDIGSVIRHAVETSQPLMRQAGHDLVITGPSDPMYVMGDTVRLSQVFANLLNNAARFTPPGGRVSIDIEQIEDAVRVQVSDTGVGIAAEELDRVFMMFTQGDVRPRPGTGLGIGLSIAKKLVEMHHGTITVQSGGRDQGSQFTVTLPIAAAAEQAGDDGADEAPSPGPRRVLVVDDNKDALESLAALLRLLGHDVRSARDGREALQVAETFWPQYVLLDIGMPKLDGYATARLLRQQEWGRRAVLVAVTGWGQEEDKRRAEEAGFDFHMTKPINPAVLSGLLAHSRTRPWRPSTSS